MIIRRVARDLFHLFERGRPDTFSPSAGSISRRIHCRNQGTEVFIVFISYKSVILFCPFQILGLINNIAEVKTLRHRLIVDPFLMALHRLLRSPLIDVAYFAAGIIAHLASGGIELWTSREVPRHAMLEELVIVTSFYQLLNCCQIFCFLRALWSWNGAAQKVKWLPIDPFRHFSI